MGFKDLFKRKPKIVEPTKDEKKETIDSIRKQIEDLKLNDKQEVKQMAKEKVDVDLEDETEFEDEEESSNDEEEDSAETEDEDLDEQAVEKKKKTTATPKIEKTSKEESKPKLSLEDVANILQTVIQNQNDLAQRLQTIEATLYRIRSA